MKDKESLKTGALVRQFTDAIQNQINDFLSDGVVTTSIVVGSIFLSGDQLLRMEQRAVGTSADLINDSGFQIDKDSARNVLARACNSSVINTSNSILTRLKEPYLSQRRRC